MRIETKYDNGDTVFNAYVGDGYKSVTCSECDGGGYLKIEGKDYRVACRVCGGRGSRGTYEPAPMAKKLTIGQVRVEIADSLGVAGHSQFSNYGPQHKREEAYMCIETGIGSGAVYYVHDLFPTEAEALERAAIKVFEWKERRAEQAAREEADRLQREKEFRDEEAATDALT